MGKRRLQINCCYISSFVDRWLRVHRSVFTLVERANRINRVVPKTDEERNMMLRDQFVETLRNAHLRWELKRRMETDDDIDFVSLRKVATLWAEEVCNESRHEDGGACTATSFDGVNHYHDTALCSTTCARRRFENIVCFQYPGPPLQRTYPNNDSFEQNECISIIYIDFAENYTCKYGNEIRADDFGNSHKQATMNTRIL